MILFLIFDIFMNICAFGHCGCGSGSGGLGGGGARLVGTIEILINFTF